MLFRITTKNFSNNYLLLCNYLLINVEGNVIRNSNNSIASTIDRRSTNVALVALFFQLLKTLQFRKNVKRPHEFRFDGL